MEYQFRIGATTHIVKMTDSSNQHLVAEIDGRKIDCEYSSIQNDCLSVIFENESFTVYHGQHDGKYFIFINGEYYEVEDASGKGDAGHGHRPVEELGDENEIRAPMPGKILKILVSVNESVKPRQALFIVESMKMENQVVARMAGIIQKINFKENDLVSTGDVVIEMEKSEN